MEEQKKWWKEAVVYQIYPRSFKDSNGDGIGDLRGILEKLDYLSYLGIDVIWMSPIFQSPNHDNGYDISDYQGIMDEFGTMEDFRLLLKESHKRGIKIILDLVVNHTSDEHPWFIKSREEKENPYWDYYIWKPAKNGKEPNNWGAWFGGSAWEYDENRKKYYFHQFSPHQPDLNWKNPKVREEIFAMMRWWLEQGIDGFRMDVINMISKTEDYSDGALKGLYGDLSPYCMNGPQVHEYLREMHEKVLCRYDIMTIGEAMEAGVEEAKKYAGAARKELNMVFQLEHLDMGRGQYGKWNDKPVNLKELKEIFGKWQEELKGTGWNSLCWSNHDQPRAVSRFGDDGTYREASAKMLATCLHMMKGTPYIYQGEEIGMTNAGFQKLEDYRDVESLQAYQELVEEAGVSHGAMMEYLKLKSRDNARTPMQWNEERQAGFTEGSPWIPVIGSYPEINVHKQRSEESSILNYYRRLIALRREKPVIVYGDFHMLLKESESVFAYERKLDGVKLTVVCNFTTQETPCGLVSETASILISNYQDRASGILRPYEAVVYEEQCKGGRL